MDSAYDVPDSTDWLNTPLKDFAELENALHCQICKEFYDTPMITSCSHTFCSKCIRTSLSTDGKCPACRTADQASKLRNNWALQEVVASFQSARPAAIGVARKQQELAAQARRPGKRKRAVLDSEDIVEVANEGRQTRSKSRQVAASQSSQNETIEIEDSDEDGAFEPEPEDGLVECLLGCGKRMKPEQMDSHLDRCEDEKKVASRAKSRTPVNGFGNQRPSAGQQNTRPQDRLAELNYSLLKENAMRKKLEELGIPGWGAKQLMVKRHTEWVNLWNANCDSRHPRSKRELLGDLDTWERTQGGRAYGGQNSLATNIMRKEFDGAGWASKNKDDFSRLIADAKRKKGNPASAESPTKEQEPEDASKPALNGDEGSSPFFPPKSLPDQDPPPLPIETSQPYADNPEALASMREKVDTSNAPHLHPEAAMNTDSQHPSRPSPKPTHSNSTTDTAQHSPGSTSRRPTTSGAPAADRPLESGSASMDTPRKSSRDEHAANEHTGSPCDLPAHLKSTPKKLPMFAVPGQAVTD
ncbi:hypothetical protein B0A50_00630 [Salinomyces thailandicus]|uniref:Postreplication repair E3 ubiquitin-protein ligase RAD18 n=1 Tax=Salinomyces thailandicus TaxID=706561 RepID=A0A4U0UEF3_9PEZI|nr:hypothetical protein B0A50_00630 [Salinomyces thailandica]